MRADDLFGDFALLAPAPPPPDGNAREAVPADAEAAAAFFRCATLDCSMRGTACATNWIAAEHGATSRPSCRGCAAGAARYRLTTLGLATPMPAQSLVSSVRTAAKCNDCGMRKTDARHTPAMCERVQIATRAALNGGEAKRRKAEREQANDRARNEAEAAKKRRDAVAQREARAKERADKRAADARAREEAKAARAAAWAEAEARLAAERAARIAAGEQVEPVNTPKPKRKARAKRRVQCTRAAGCSRITTGSAVGAFCPRCVSIATRAVSRQLGRDATPDEIAARLLDPHWQPRSTVADWSGVDWSRSNAEIGRDLGVPTGCVFKARKARGIPANAKTQRVDIDWAAAGLGTAPDSQIARRLGCSTEAVFNARQRLGVPAYADKRTAGIDWSALPLGKVPDTQIARELGVSKTVVRIARTEFGIAPGPNHAPPPDAGVDWSTVDMREPNSVIAAKYGISLRTVSRRRAAMGFTVKKQPERYDWSKAEFGRKSDVEIAGEMGVSITAVARARRRRGIGRAAHSAYDRDIDWDVVDYSLSDAANAKIIGCDPRLVTRERKARGIERKVIGKAASAESLAVSHETVRAQYAEMLDRFNKRKAARDAAWARRNGKARPGSVDAGAPGADETNNVQDGGVA